MNGGLIYRDRLRAPRRFWKEGQGGIAEEISRWHDDQREFLARLISPESQRRLERTVQALRSAEHPGELQKAVEELRGALGDLQAEITEAVPGRAGELQSITEAVQELARRLLVGGQISDPDIRAEIKARNIPKFPKEQRSVPKNDRIDPLEFLERYYGDFLIYFGAPRNLISQLDLGEIDPELMTSLRNRVNYLVRKRGSKTELREIIPPYSDLLTEQLEGVPREQLLLSARLGSALQSRERRAKRSKAQ